MKTSTTERSCTQCRGQDKDERPGWPIEEQDRCAHLSENPLKINLVGVGCERIQESTERELDARELKNPQRGSHSKDGSRKKRNDDDASKSLTQEVQVEEISLAQARALYPLMALA